METKIFISYLILSSLLFGRASHTDVEAPGRIGIKKGWTNNKIYKVFKNSPAESAGIKVGDKVIKVIDENGKKEITGPAGSSVTITLRKQDKSTYTVEITRAPLNSPIFEEGSNGQ